VAKERLEAAAVLKKSVYSTKQQGFHKIHLQKYAWGHGGGRFQSGWDYKQSQKRHGMGARAKPGISQGKK